MFNFVKGVLVLALATCLVCGCILLFHPLSNGTGFFLLGMAVVIAIVLAAFSKI